VTKVGHEINNIIQADGHLWHDVKLRCTCFSLHRFMLSWCYKFLRLVSLESFQ